MSDLTVGQLCDRLREEYPAVRGELIPKDISTVIYNSRVLVHDIPTVAGRRMVPLSMVPVVVSELRRAGKLPPLSMPVAKGGGRCRD